MESRPSVNVFIGNQRVYFKPVAGEYRQDIRVQEREFTQEQVEVALAYKQKDCALLGYVGVYLPAVPALDLDFSYLTEEIEHEINLAQVLIKCEEGDREAIIGKDFYMSGRRSAILVQPDGTLIRLKGCGNDTKGFNLQPMPYPDTWNEVRGCQFSNTVFREMFYSERLGKILAPYNVQVRTSAINVLKQCGNVPIGVWEYTDKIDNAVNECPKLKKYCGIFKTLGEKRLATNLIQGLLKLLSISIQAQGDTITDAHYSQIKDLFPPARINEQTGEIKKTFTTKKYRDPSKFTPSMTHLDWIQSQKIYSDEENSILKEIPAESFKIADEGFQTLKLSNFSEFQIDREMEKLFETLLVQAKSQGQFTQTISAIFKRIGFECGLIKRVMDENLISWGYYIDHNPFEPHCNAHPNNFVVLDINDEQPNILAPLDYDLAYDFKNFVNHNEDSKEKFGTNDREQFDDWSGMEKYELEASLGGDENMANFSYSEGSAQEQNLNGQRFAEAIEIGLRDTCVLEYRTTYDKVNDWKDSIEWRGSILNAKTLIKMALILTDKERT